MENTYRRLATADGPAPAQPAGPRAAFRSRFEPGAGEEVLFIAPKDTWCDRLAKYRQRKVSRVAQAAAARPRALGIGGAAIPGAINWEPLGPGIVLNGQTVGQNPVAGRIVGITMAPGGSPVYVASAAGGVFRSDDHGATWRSLMDGFDLNPTDFASASLACGAIAIDPNDPDRVYVGTGEGDTFALFNSRITNALPAYRGIGPIRSDDGGLTWITESSATGSPDLAGDAFFSLAVDPRDRENVVAATTLGIYQRVPTGNGDFEWELQRADVHSDVVVASNGGTTRFFAAEWGVGVFRSNDGSSWIRAGRGFPSTSVGRIALAVQPDNPGMIYALVAEPDGSARGLWRLDSMTGNWNLVRALPTFLPGSQGSYDIDIAVDPTDDMIVYLAGDHMGASPWAGSVWRAEIVRTASAYRVGSSRSIGTHAHADVHVLTHTPGNPDELWCGTDGGVFLNRDPVGSGEFGSRNQGLSCLCSNFIAQHPTDPGILFTGLQDNGTARTSSGPTWSHVSGGDGGYCLINWANPNQVLVFANGTILRSTTGGTSHSSWSTEFNFGWVTMTQPIVGTPYNPARPADAKYVATAAGSSVFVSKNFASSFTMSFDLPNGSQNIFALALASTSRMFIGTTNGRVFRADRSGLTWSLTRLDNVAPPPRLMPNGLITDVAVDWNDTNLESVFVCFGGMGNAQRVFRFDGANWENRSGVPGTSDLLDVEHNALVVDPQAPDNVYVGADIGVWHSDDSGQNWQPFENGLPDSPVFDLQIHPTQRLLRAATHGRGLYEIRLT